MEWDLDNSGSLYFAENIPEFMLGYLMNIYITTNGNRWGVDVRIIRTESSKLIIQLSQTFVIKSRDTESFTSAASLCQSQPLSTSYNY